MTLGMFVSWVGLGLVTGWLVGALVKAGGHGRWSDLVLGLTGSGMLTAVAAAVGIPAAVGAPAMAGLAIAGAAFAVVGQRKIWPAPG